MPSGIPIADEEAQEYRRLYLDENMGIVAIANKFDRSTFAVWNNLHKLGVTMRKGSGPRQDRRGIFKSRGMSRHPHFPTWVGMMLRCYSDKAPGYRDYGARGIEVFGPWHDPRVYIEYVETILGSKPGPGYTIDRIDNDGNYGPGNVQWADRSTQLRNRDFGRNGRNSLATKRLG